MSGIPGVNEKDWKLLRSRLPGWQEAYMDKLNHEYMAILSGEGRPSEKFWKLHDRIRQDIYSSGVQVVMKRSNMKIILMNLLEEEMDNPMNSDAFYGRVDTLLSGMEDLIRDFHLDTQEI